MRDHFKKMVLQTVDSPSPLPPTPTTVTKAHPHSSHPPVPHSAGVFSTSSFSLPSPLPSKTAVQPLSLPTTVPPSSSSHANTAIISETPPSVIGPSAHLAGRVMSHDTPVGHVMSHDTPVGHVMSHGASHDQKQQVFSPTTDDDQMKHIEKVCCKSEKNTCVYNMRFCDLHRLLKLFYRQKKK